MYYYKDIYLLDIVVNDSRRPLENCPTALLCDRKGRVINALLYADRS